MASTLQTLAQSESKTLFLQRLGLDTSNPNDKAVYHLMKAEAIRERDYMHQDRGNLHPHLRDDMAYRSPYSYSWLTETAVHRATIRVFENASLATRHLYDQGRYTTVVEENWVIRWLLWHVFRYRDGRRARRLVRMHEESAPAASDESQTFSTLPHGVSVAAGRHDNNIIRRDTGLPDVRSYTRASSPSASPPLARRQRVSEQESDIEHTSEDDRGISSNLTAQSLHAESSAGRKFDPIRDV